MSRPDRAGDDAVSDVVGSILLVAITVILAVVMGGLVFAFKGPVDTPQANLAVTVSPGNAQWGNGDELLLVRNLGGEALDAAQTTILYRINSGNPVTVTGSALGFPNGRLAIGQTWSLTTTLASTDNVLLNVLARQPGSGTSTLLATATLVPGQVSAGASCPFDTTAPTTSAFVQSPSDLTALSTGPVTITATILDNCSGVSTSSPPQLFWRLRGLTAPSYTAGTMAPQGLGLWTATVPDQTWSNQAGKVFEYYVTAADVRGNAGQSATQSDTVGSDCTGDTTPPGVSVWSTTPANLVSTTPIGAIPVTITITDNCWGVDDTTATPGLTWRVNDGTNPAYSSPITMTRVGAVSAHQWTASVPSQVWYQQAARTLQLVATNLKDSAGNTGSSAAYSDLVDIVTPTYIAGSGIAATAGTITNAAGATAVGGTEATLAEVPATFATFAGASATGGTNPTNALAADGSRATLSTTAAVLDVTGYWATPPAGAGGITDVQVGFIARKSGSGTSPTLTLGYKVGSTTGATSLPGQTLASNSADTTTTLDVMGDRSWTAADVQALHVTLQATAISTNALVDQLFVKVSYAVAGGAGRAMDQVLAFASVPNFTPGTGAETVELGYHLSPITLNDVFTVEAYNPTTGAWRTCAGQLNSVSLTAVAYTCALAAIEYNGGAPTVRIRDVNPAGTVTTSVLLDYAKVNTT